VSKEDFASGIPTYLQEKSYKRNFIRLAYVGEESILPETKLVMNKRYSLHPGPKYRLNLQE